GPVLTLTVHGDGVSWTRHGAVNPLRSRLDDENDLNGVAVAGGDAWSAGFYANFDSGPPAHTLVERWSGSNWYRVSVPNPGGASVDNELWDIEALSPTDVWAVGTIGQDGSASNQTLVEHWDGSAWTVPPTPPGVLIRAAGDPP